MKKLVATLLVFLLLSSIATISTVASEQSFGRVDTEGSNLNVRSGPDTSHAVIGSLKDGSTVVVLGEENGWYRVLYADQKGQAVTGYVSGSYLIVTP